jgi:macrolide transport system ATP-binding/permease protein
MLEARSLTKYYDHTPAVREVSFTIAPGEILGYLGSNGAGKSTTVKMLTGLIEPSEGQILYQGRSVREDYTAFQRRIGYVPEEAHLYPHLSGREYLQLVGRLRGIERRELEHKMDEFLRLFSLWNDRHDPLSSYSKGMRQKILLSAALLHNPDVLILDEPFSGLDVTSALVLRRLLRGLAEQGKMILYSSHVLEVVEKVCSKVLILRKGEVVAYDSVDRLRELMSQPSLEGVFAQLTEVEDGEALAEQILGVMNSGEALSPQRPVEIGLRVYRTLAGAFPHEFQNVYRDELLQVTETAIEPIWRCHGLLGLARLLLDMAIRVPAEYMAEFRQDVRYGLRALSASPGFTAVALVSLSLGICIATCAFSQMNGMALRSLPAVQSPSELVALQSPTSYPNYKRFREQGDLFSSSMAYAAPVPFAVSLGGNTERTWGHLVTSSYFSTLGVRPALGSFFHPSQDVQGHAPIIVVSHRFWRDRLGGDPSVIGKTLRINGRPTTVIGVAPDEFLGASPLLFAADLWMPVSVGGGIAPELSDNALERQDVPMFFVVGRVRAGVTIPRAEAELDAVAQQFDRDRIDVDSTRKGRRVLLVEGGKLLPLRKQDLPFFTSFLAIMAAMITLIACANVANMMLARAAGRRREIAVRLALGASRARLIRQLLTESMMLAIAAGVAGFLASTWLMTLGSQVRMPFPMPVAFDFRPDGGVLLLTIAVSLCTGLVFGLAPALQATRTDLGSALKEGGNLFFRAHRRFRLRNVLMVSQVAGSLTLLVVLGLLSLGIQTTLGIQAGFDPRKLYLISVDPIRDGYSGERAAVYFDKLLERVKALPSITAATLTETAPVSMPGSAVTVSTPTGPRRTTIRAMKHVTGKDYFDTTGIPILFGRGFRKQDEAEQSAAVVVSEALARQLWEGGESVGRRIEIGNGEIGAPKVLPGSFDYRPTVPGGGLQSFEVIGVAADVAEGLVVGKPRPALYFPLRPSSYRHPSLQGVTLMVRAKPGVDALAAVRREMSLIDEGITPFNARSMNEQINQFMAPLQMAAWTYGLIGVFGLVLASVGLAGVTAYSVAQRSREIGIRMALGAKSQDVLSLVMKEGFVLVGAGTSIGMMSAWAGARMLSAMNSSVGRVSSTSTSDPTVLIGAPLVLAVLALIACYVPARKSMRIDPAVTLRQE